MVPCHIAEGTPQPWLCLDVIRVIHLKFPLVCGFSSAFIPNAGSPRKGEEKLSGERRHQGTTREEQWSGDVVGVRPALDTPLLLQQWPLVTMGAEQGNGPHHSCSHTQGAFGRGSGFPTKDGGKERGVSDFNPSPGSFPGTFLGHLEFPSRVPTAKGWAGTAYHLPLGEPCPQD